MPIPDNVELSTPQQKEWPLIPTDVYQAEITDIEYRTEPNRFKREATDPDEKPVMKFEFTIIEDGPHYGRKMWQRMAPTKPQPPKQNGKASWVWRIASALAGHAITEDEGKGYTTSDINGFIHRQIRMNLVQAPGKDSKMYNNIDGFLPVKVQLPPFDPNKVPKDNQQEAPKQPQSGYERAKAVADNLPGATPAIPGQNTPDSGPSKYSDKNIVS